MRPWKWHTFFSLGSARRLLSSARHKGHSRSPHQSDTLTSAILSSTKWKYLYRMKWFPAVITKINVAFFAFYLHPCYPFCWSVFVVLVWQQFLQSSALFSSLFLRLFLTHYAGCLLENFLLAIVYLENLWNHLLYTCCWSIISIRDRKMAIKCFVYLRWMVGVWSRCLGWPGCQTQLRLRT